MQFKKFKNVVQLNRYKKKENSLKINKFLFIYLLNILQFKNVGLYNKTESENLRKQYLFLQLLSSKISKTKLYRNCIMSGRPRAVYRPYGISRCGLKELIQFGRLPGYTKSVW
jgi:small subunit ribosomal protein S14